MADGNVAMMFRAVVVRDPKRISSLIPSSDDDIPRPEELPGFFTVVGDQMRAWVRDPRKFVKDIIRVPNPLDREIRCHAFVLREPSGQEAHFYYQGSDAPAFDVASRHRIEDEVLDLEIVALHNALIEADLAGWEASTRAMSQFGRREIDQLIFR